MGWGWLFLRSIGILGFFVAVQRPRAVQQIFQTAVRGRARGLRGRRASRVRSGIDHPRIIRLPFQPFDRLFQSRIGWHGRVRHLLVRFEASYQSVYGVLMKFVGGVGALVPGRPRVTDSHLGTFQQPGEVGGSLGIGHFSQFFWKRSDVILGVPSGHFRSVNRGARSLILLARAGPPHLARILERHWSLPYSKKNLEYIYDTPVRGEYNREF